MKNQKRRKTNCLAGIALICLTLFSMTTVQAQDTTTTTDTFVVKGNISDETGPLPGVNIVLQGTSVGVATDINGYFEFPQKLKKGDVLLLSSIGYESRRIIIKDQKSASNIKLEIDMELTEIVITGKVATKKVYSSKKNKDQ